MTEREEFKPTVTIVTDGVKTQWSADDVIETADWIVKGGGYSPFCVKQLAQAAAAWLRRMEQEG